MVEILPSFTVSYAGQVQGANTNLYGVSLGISLPVWFLLDTRAQIQEAAAYACSSRIWRHGTGERGRPRCPQRLSRVHERRPPGADLCRRNCSRKAKRSSGSPMPATRRARSRISNTRRPTNPHLGPAGVIDALLRYNTAFARLELAVGRELQD